MLDHVKYIMQVLVYSEESMVNCSVVLKIDSQDTFSYCCTNTGNFYKVNLSSIQDTARYAIPSLKVNLWIIQIQLGIPFFH